MEHAEIARNPELFVSMLQNLDGWKTKPSPFFNGGVQIDKTRKKNDPISIHYLPAEGRFRKIAEEALYSPKVEREFRFWQTALDHFGINEDVRMDHIKRLKTDPSRGYQSLVYIDMPYMGLPLHYSELLIPGKIPESAQQTFFDKMHTLVTDKHMFHPDMNPGNILVSIQDGIPVLFPIDWESGNPKVSHDKRDYYAQEQEKRCRETLEQFYPAREVVAI